MARNKSRTPNWRKEAQKRGEWKAATRNSIVKQRDLHFHLMARLDKAQSNVR